MQPWGQSPKSTSPSSTFRPEQIPWQVNLPEYVYNNGPNTHPNEMQHEMHPSHNYHQQADMSRRHEHFAYAQGQPNADAPQHHANTVPQVPQVQQVQQVQPPAPLNVPPPQPPSQSAPANTQQPQTQPQPQPTQVPPVTPTTTTTGGGRQRKRPAPGTSNAAQAGAAAAQNQASSAPAAQANPSTSATDAPGISAPAAAQANPPTTATDDSVAPPPKKSRTNTPWTPEEEHRLKAMRDEGKSWAEIAKTFPTRTEGSVKKHWYKDMHYAEFAQDESEQLLQAIKEYEANKWKVIGAKLGKPAKACEQYAKEHFPHASELFPNSNKR